jgi:hypothetical protein
MCSARALAANAVPGITGPAKVQRALTQGMLTSSVRMKFSSRRTVALLSQRRACLEHRRRRHQHRVALTPPPPMPPPASVPFCAIRHPQPPARGVHVQQQQRQRQRRTSLAWSKCQLLMHSTQPAPCRVHPGSTHLLNEVMDSALGAVFQKCKPNRTGKVPPGRATSAPNTGPRSKSAPHYP